MAAERIGSQYLAAAVALAVAALLLLGEVDAGRRARPAWPLVVGAALIVLRLSIAPAGSSTLAQPPLGNGPWELIVASTGSPHDGHQSATLSTPPGAPVAFAVAATLPRYPEVVAGDRVTVDGEIRPRPTSAYGDYLARIGAVGTLTARTIRVGQAPADLGRRLEDLRRGAGDALARVLPEPEAGLAAGILIGLRDRVDRDLASAFTTAGVSHVVAISGWNIAIVAAAIAAIAGRLGRRRRSVVTMLAIVGYVAFAGASASVVRAALMAGVVLLARETGRAGRAAAALGWAAVLLLLADPRLIGDAGFQLSSLATAGLIAWATPLTAWIESIGRGHVPRWLAESLGVSLAAQAATLPIVLVSFGRLAVLAPAVNLAVVPLVAPAMAVGLVAMGGGAIVGLGVPAVVGAILAAPGWVVLRILDAIVTGAASVPFASLSLAPPLDVVAAAVSTGGLLGLTWWRRRGRSRADHGAATAATVPDVAAPHAGSGRPAPFAGPGRAARRHAVADHRRRRGRRRGCGAPGGLRPGDDSRRRPRGRHPGRRVARGPIADRWRPGSGAAARGAGRTRPALGPPDRHGDPHPSTRGSRGRPGPSAGPLPRRPRVRTGDARTRAGIRRLGGTTGAGRCAGPRGDRRGRPPAGRRDRTPGAVADSGPGADPATGRRDGHQQRVGRPARPGWFPTLPADGRRRAGDRSPVARRRAAAGRPAQGRPSRQQDRHHAAFRGRRPTARRGGLGRGRQSVWSSGQSNVGSTGGGRSARPADRPRWNGGRRVRAGRHDRALGGRPPGRGPPIRGVATTVREPGRRGGRIPLRHPGHRPRPGT